MSENISKEINEKMDEKQTESMSNPTEKKAKKSIFKLEKSPKHEIVIATIVLTVFFIKIGYDIFNYMSTQRSMDISSQQATQTEPFDKMIKNLNDIPSK